MFLNPTPNPDPLQAFCSASALPANVGRRRPSHLMEPNMPIPDRYDADAERLARAPRTKRPTIYNEIRLRELARCRGAVVPERMLVHHVRHMMECHASQVARMDAERAERAYRATTDVVRFPLERRLGRAA